MFFVPPTPGGILLKKLKKTEQDFQIGENDRIKFVELSGVKYKEYYKSADPYAINCDPKIGCFICKDQRSSAPTLVEMDLQTNVRPVTLDSEDLRSTAPPLIGQKLSSTTQTKSKPTNCKISNVGYTISCKLCKERNKNITYEGETARNGFIRGKEHKKAYEKRNKNSVLYKHVLYEHENEEDKVDYEMKIVGKIKNPLARQMDESIRIRNKPADLLKNSKAEFHGPCIKKKILQQWNMEKTFF